MLPDTGDLPNSLLTAGGLCKENRPKIYDAEE